MRHSLTICFALMGLVQQAHASDLLAPPSQTVAGRNLEDIAIEWWRWVMTNRAGPDKKKQQCAATGTPSIWFVAGFSDKGKYKAECTIPEGKHLVLRILTTLSTQSATLPCNSVARVEKEELDAVTVEINGTKVENLGKYRISNNNCFNPYNAKSSVIAVSDGYWLLIKPPPKGKHIFKIDDKSGDTEEYEITIE